MKIIFNKAVDFYNLFLSLPECMTIELILKDERLYVLHFHNDITYYKSIPVTIEESSFSSNSSTNFTDGLSLNYGFLAEAINLSFKRKTHQLSIELENESVIISNSALCTKVPVKPASNLISEKIDEDFFGEFARMSVPEYRNLIRASLTVADYYENIIPRLKLSQEDSTTFTFEFKLNSLYYEAISHAQAVWGAIKCQLFSEGLTSIFKLQVPSSAIALSVLLLDKNTKYVSFSEDVFSFKISTNNGAIIVPVKPAYFRLAKAERVFNFMFTSTLNLSSNKQYKEETFKKNTLGDYFGEVIPTSYRDLSFDRHLILKALENISGKRSYPFSLKESLTISLARHREDNKLYGLFITSDATSTSQMILSQTVVSDLQDTVIFRNHSSLEREPNTYQIATAYVPINEEFYSLAETEAILQKTLRGGSMSLAWEIQHFYDVILERIHNLFDYISFDFSESKYKSVPNCVKIALNAASYWDVCQTTDTLEESINNITPEEYYLSHLNSWISSPVMTIYNSASVIEEYEESQSWKVQYIFQ